MAKLIRKKGKKRISVREDKRVLYNRERRFPYSSLEN